MGRKWFLFPLIIEVLIIPSLISAGWMRTYGGKVVNGVHASGKHPIPVI
jgi:hypothetical protein